MRMRTTLLVTASLLLWTVGCHAFNCSVSTTPVAFRYDVFAPSPSDSTGSITVSCSNPAQKPIPVTISISSGKSGTFNPRQMTAAIGTDRLNYYLFTDPSRTIIWGDGTGGSSTVTSVVTRDATLVATVYGRMLPLQNVRAGNYNDALVVTVLW